MSSIEIKKNYKFNLINGIFEPDEVSSLVSVLFNSKIEHHNRKILKQKETNKNSFKEEEEQRVLQLESARNSFQNLMLKASEMGYKTIIKGDIHVEFIKK